MTTTHAALESTERTRFKILPVRADFDALDPVSSAAIRPALQGNFPIVDNDLVIRGADDGAPVSTNGLFRILSNPKKAETLTTPAWLGWRTHC